MSALWMTEEQYAAHQARVASARVVRPMGEEVKPGRPAKVKAPKVPKLRESDVLKGCIRLLDSHPGIAIWWRQNTGAVKVDERYVKFSFKGASDLMAVTRTGRFCAIECKATGKWTTPEQDAFLSRVKEAGGLSVCVDHPNKLADALEELIPF